MPNFPDTRHSLIARVRDPSDAEAWRDFAAAYGPAVYRLARKRGLQPADADDLTQKVLIAVSRAVGGWEPDPARGRFRSWLSTIARNAAVNALSRRPPDAAAGGSAVLELLAGQPESDDQTRDALRLETRRALFRLAAARVREELGGATWEAFRLTAIEGLTAEVAAARLGKTVGAVYAARGRVTRRLRDEVDRHRDDLAEER
jgi:RNA polymerase sigma-70 factor (ECF subfamily)